MKPRVFRDERGGLHIALLAFPHVSQTLCGLRLTDLEFIQQRDDMCSLLCKTCTLKLGALAARLLEI